MYPQIAQMNADFPLPTQGMKKGEAPQGGP